jgi:hypothetical protein
MHTTIIWNVDSTYMLPMYGESMIMSHMANLLFGVSTVGWIVQYVWMTLMHSGWSTIRKSISFIVIEDSFYWITHSGVIDDHFWKAKPLQKGYQMKNSEQISWKCSMTWRSKKMVCSKVTVKITTELIKIFFGNSLIQKHWYYPTTSIWCTRSKTL